MADSVRASYAIPKEMSAYKAADKWLQWQLEEKEAIDNQLPEPVFPKELWWFNGDRLTTIPETSYD